MKTRIHFFQGKAANDRWKVRRQMMFHFNVAELQASTSDPILTKLLGNLSAKFGIESHQALVNDVPVMDHAPACLNPIWLKLHGDPLRDSIEIHTLQDDQDTASYFVIVHADSYRNYQHTAQGDKISGEIKGEIELAYYVKLNKNNLSCTYKLLTFDTDNVFIYNAMNSEHDITPEIEQEAREDVSAINKSEEEKLAITIANILPGNELMKEKAQAVLDQVKAHKSRTSSKANLQELDDVLISTRDFISTEPYCKPEHADTLNDAETKANNVANLANKFKKSSRYKILGGVLISLLAAAIVAVCVAALVLSCGIAAVPIAVMSVACVAGGVSAFSIFRSARHDFKLQESMQALSESVSPPQPLV